MMIKRRCAVTAVQLASVTGIIGENYVAASLEDEEENSHMAAQHVEVVARTELQRMDPLMLFAGPTDYLHLSPNGRHLAVMSYGDHGDELYHDGAMIGGFRGITGDTIRLSDDGQTLAFSAATTDEDVAGKYAHRRIIWDGTAGPAFGSINYLTMTRDGRHIAYEGRVVEQGTFVVVNHRRFGPYERVLTRRMGSRFHFSPDGTTVAYAVKALDGWEGVKVNGFRTNLATMPMWDSTGEHQASVHKNAAEGFDIVVNGEVMYTEIDERPELIAFGRDGRLAWLERSTGNRERLHFGETTGPWFSRESGAAIRQIEVVGDGRRVVYIGYDSESARWQFMDNHARVMEFDSPGPYGRNVAVSDKGNAYVVVVEREGDYFAIANRRVSELPGRSYELAVSDAGRRWAVLCVAERGDGREIITDRSQYQVATGAYGMTFSPCGEHLAYLEVVANERRAVRAAVDGVTMEETLSHMVPIEEPRLTFLDSNRFMYFEFVWPEGASDNGERGVIYRTEIQFE